MPSLTFLGATQTVTGSKYLLEAAGERLLIDCGLFQGPKELRLRNWNPFPVDPSSLHWVVLTHAHLDHTGYLPRLVRDGFRGPVWASSATVDLSPTCLCWIPGICRKKMPPMPTGRLSASTNLPSRSTPWTMRPNPLNFFGRPMSQSPWNFLPISV